MTPQEQREIRAAMVGCHTPYVAADVLDTVRRNIRKQTRRAPPATPEWTARVLGEAARLVRLDSKHRQVPVDATGPWNHAERMRAEAETLLDRGEYELAQDYFAKALAAHGEAEVVAAPVRAVRHVEEAARRQERDRRDALERAGVPPRLLNARFDTSQSTTALKAAQQFVSQGLPDGCCLILAGPPGVGKSWAAVAALDAAWDRGWHRGDMRFEHTARWLRAIRNFDTEEDAWRRVRRRLLVLDDLDATDDADRRALDELLCHREAEQLATILTTNLTVEALQGRLSDRVLDRIRGLWGQGRVVACAGDSLRHTSTRCQVRNLPAGQIGRRAG